MGKAMTCNSACARSNAAIQEHLLDPLATKLLAGEFKPGDKIKVTSKDDELVFQRK